MKNRRLAMKPADTGDNEWFARLALGAVAVAGLLLLLPEAWMAVAGGVAFLVAWVWLAERRLAYNERVAYRNLLIVVLGLAISVSVLVRQSQDEKREATREQGR